MPAYRRLFDLRLGGRARADAEMDRELESHLAMREADLVRGGLSPEDARAEARRRFGDFELARRQLHSAARQRQSATRQRDRLGTILADLRYGVRQARRAPGFTALAIASLAIGIGAMTTIFSLVEHVLLRPLPFARAAELVSITGLDSARARIETVAAPQWADWRKAGALTDAALYGFAYRQGLVAADSAFRVDAQRVSGNYFDVLGARFVTGRPFTEQEAEAGEAVVVVSEGLWRRTFGADRTLSTPLRTAHRTYTIVGVVAEGQEFPAGTEAYFPASLAPQAAGPRVNVNWTMIGRLKPGATTERAATEMSAIARGALANDPNALYDHGVEVEPLANALVGDISRYLRMLMAVVLCVLLIVCANVAASSLARASARGREMAVRASLGAGRGRLVQQMLVEHLLLGVAGGAAGLFMAWAALRIILSRWGDQIPRSAEVVMDTRVFLFALAASLLAGVLAGALPAARLSRVSLRSMLSSGGRNSVRGGRNLAGASLVTFEIAAALLLLAGAALLVRSFRSVMGRDIGFETNVATVDVTLSGDRYADAAARETYWRRLIDEYRAIPGAQAVGVTNWVPLGLTGQGFIEVEGQEAAGAGAVYRTVSEDFFRALQIPIVVGRAFDERDGEGGERVTVINQTMAARYWPGENPIGRRVRAVSMEQPFDGSPAPWLTVIGVVGDVRTYGLETDPRAEMYVDYRQRPLWTTSMIAVVRGSGPASRLSDALRGAARSVDSQLAIDVGSLDDRLRDTLATRVLTMWLVSAFSAIAVVLAAIGIYGVLSYAVSQRARELALRAALGAPPARLLGLMLGAGLRVVAGGVLVGLVAAVALTRVLESMLFEVAPRDPWSYGAAIAVLLAVCMAAILIPARNATRLDPMIALQGD